MINTNDLRVGNWAMLIESGEVVRVTVGGLAANDIKNNKGGYYDPVPLTPEWMVRFKFQMQKPGTFFTWWVYKGWKLVECNMSTHKFYKAGKYYWESPTVDVELEFVHEIQNLYYSLMHKELDNGNSSKIK